MKSDDILFIIIPKFIIKISKLIAHFQSQSQCKIVHQLKVLSIQIKQKRNQT